ncbi:YtpR family tRNA-binding protein [Oceanobacillus sp. FSL W7-1293]|uniref:YtpR family tRNA-binding protein n=1 Tax=Oceanobacillus sp. FSL W7-1293 TaxID=2921699 RepID=UPI0030D2187E
MDVFYNRQGIGDVLILPIKEGDRYELKQETNGDITKITSADGEVLGYNIFHASTYFQLDEKNGAIPLTENLLAEIRTLFQKKGIDDPLEFDLSPKFVVGFVKSKQAHENADKLSVCQIDVGEETLQIVCGAPNIDEGQKVVVAKVGATMPSGMKIKASELRGVPSHGMVCSQKELGLPDAPKEKGIYVLDGTYQIGEEFPF